MQTKEWIEENLPEKISYEKNQQKLYKIEIYKDSNMFTEIEKS